jgi:FlaG/FlaF family flagellin (archaellin)
MNKKALSGVIVTVLLIGLSVVLVGVVWAVITNIVGENVENTQNCFGNFDKVNLNPSYTCYNSTNKELHFSINVGEIDLAGVVVLISGSGITHSVTLTKEDLSRNYLKYYGGSFGENVVAPKNNSGRTYVINLAHADVGINDGPDLVQISPIIGKTQCEVSSSINKIEACEISA